MAAPGRPRGPGLQSRGSAAAGPAPGAAARRSLHCAAPVTAIEDTELAPNPPSRHAWRLLLVLLVAGVAWLAFSPNPPPRATTGWDKANHAIAFCLMAFAALRAFPRAAPATVPATLLGYGVLIEIVQAFVPGRSAEPVDVVADAIGLAIGALLALGWRRWRGT